MPDYKVKTIISEVGADVEYRFARKKGEEYVNVAASTFAGSGGMSAFCGTDGHSSTGEMRPNPARSVHSLLFEVAHGLVEINEALGPSLKVLAAPAVFGEPIGGHIHISFFVKGKEFSDYIACSMFPAGAGSFTSPLRGGACGYTPEETRQAANWVTSDSTNPETAAHWQMLKETGVLPTPGNVCRALTWLLGPLELWVQPWVHRVNRNRTYGGLNDVRHDGQPSVRPKGREVAKAAFIKYEYRAPSTWLWHPAIAYSYLGLAKLVVMNYDLIGPHMPKEEKFAKSKNGGTPYHDYFQDLLKRRLDKLMETKDIKTEPDLKDLPKVLGRLQNIIEPYQKAVVNEIQLDAWKEVLR